MLANVRIPYRLTLAVAVPTVLLVGLVGHNLADKWSLRSEMAQLGPLADGVVKLSRVVHELQRERGMSAIVLSSKGAQMRSELAAQRKRSDEARAPALSIMDVLAARASGDFKDAIEKAKAAIAALDGRRGEIDALSIAPPN